MPLRPRLFAVFLLIALAVLFPKFSAAQHDSSTPFSSVGLGVKVSLLGAGIEAAVPLSRRSNLRGGFNAFSYDRGFSKDGVAYAGQLGFRSAEAHYDWFPFGHSFHLSPGVLLYNGNQISANASVAAGQTFTLNGTTYSSDPADPVTGTGKVDFKKAGPMFTLGWGNLLPRGHGRISVPFEIGAIYTGSPQASLNLAGSACDSSGANCSAIASNPSIQSNVVAEQNRLNTDMAAFKFYPVISLGFGVKF
jgi:hypothetical protein